MKACREDSDGGEDAKGERTKRATIAGVVIEGDRAECGLLSEREATDVLNEKRKDPIGACVEALAGYDWSKTRKRAAGVKVVKVRRSGDAATVALSSGRRAMLVMREGRWVIDDIERPRPKARRTVRRGANMTPFSPLRGLARRISADGLAYRGSLR